MIRVKVSNDRQQTQLEHAAGALEFGRGPQRGVARIVIEDAFCSRDQLRVEERPGQRLFVENLSTKNPISLSTGNVLAVGSTAEVDLPTRLSVGRTTVDIGGPVDPGSTPRPDTSSLMTVQQPMLGERSSGSLTSLGAAPPPEKLAHFLEAVVTLQRGEGTDREFFDRAVHTLVDLIALDTGMLLLRRDGAWTPVAQAVAADDCTPQFSRSLLDYVAAQRQTFYQDPCDWGERTISLAEVAAVVVSPIFGLGDEVVGALYGQRKRRALTRVGKIKPLEAQVVQLLAAAVGAYLTRAAAARTRVQFEQFFSPELVRELERDPNLLEGREQEVTTLVSDMRGFSSLAERLGAVNTCRLVRDMMERMTERIVGQGGVIVDYAGDGILAMWNAPTALSDHAARACTAALEMLAEMPALNARWQSMVDQPLRLGIGLNTGTALVGNTGSSRKFKYGPHGHSVNVASRVQDTTKRLGLPLLITESTRAPLPDDFALRRLGRVRLAGIETPVSLFELHGKDATPEWQAQRQVYEESLESFEKGQWGRALRTLMCLPGWTDELNHRDTPSLKLMKRAVSCLEAPPEPFDSVIE
jgi:adenylate cyclase